MSRTNVEPIAGQAGSWKCSTQETLPQ